MAEDSIKRLYVQNVDLWEKILAVQHFSDRELGVKIVERGIVLPVRKKEGKSGYEGGVCDNDFNFVAGSSRKPNNGGGWASVISSYTVDKSELVQLDEDVIFGGSIIGQFGHFMLECWNRLWYVIQNPNLKCKILFTITRWGRHTWFDEFFRLMGIDAERIVYVDKPTQCRSITVPDQSQYNPYSFTKEFFIPYQAIKSRVTPSNFKKLYLTRTKLIAETKKQKLKHVFNEEYFEDFFAKRGFEVIAPETLSIEEQISLIMGADEIVSTLGTLAHWALFCKPNAKFIILLRTHELLMNQAFVFGATNIEQYFVDVSKNFMYATHTVSLCLIGSTKYWKEFVADYFGEDISEDDDSSYLGAALEKYTELWCRRYVGAESKKFNIVLSSLRDMCNRIVTLEQERINHRPLLTYQTHVARSGWGTWITEEQISNPVNQKRDIQAVKIKFSQPFYSVLYSVYYNETEGWSQEVSDGEQAGITGKRKSIFGLKIRLDDSGGGYVRYSLPRAHFQRRMDTLGSKRRRAPIAGCQVGCHPDKIDRQISNITRAKKSRLRSGIFLCQKLFSTPSSPSRR